VRLPTAIFETAFDYFGKTTICYDAGTRGWCLIQVKSPSCPKNGFLAPQRWQKWTMGRTGFYVT